MKSGAKVWRHRVGEMALDRTRIMGVLNVTPDSFSDGGRFFDPEAALVHGLAMADQGADLLDVGGESTRPGSDPVSDEEEWRRIAPVIRGLASKVDVPLSVDTMKPVVASQAIKAGASIVNDVSGLQDPAMVRLVAANHVGVVAMHMLGDPKTMQQHPRYSDVVGEVRAFLAERVKVLETAGVASDAIAIDPGVGFGKSLEHNLTLLRGLDRLVELGHPVVVGVSRKSFIEKLAGGEPGERLSGSLAAATLAVSKGAHVIRAHDVRETVRAMRVANGILRRGDDSD
jgi:dihydropteroate synthase